MYNKIVELIENGENLFITGGAGTGKSYTLQRLRKKYPNSIVCAPTGVAALNVDGTTIHRAFGIPVFDNLYKSIEAKLFMKVRKEIRERLQHVNMIFIDEISMVRADILDFIDKRLRFIKGCSDPFGGIQVICFGDPFQLPPVTNRSYSESRVWFFEADVWKKAEFKIVELNKVYRQNDQAFVDILHRIRIGKPTVEDFQILNSLVTSEINYDRFTILAGINNKVKRINESKLCEINSKEYTYKAIIKEDFNPNSCIAEKVLKLKKGAKVLSLINNDKEGYVNGSVGIVEDLDQNGVTVKFEHLGYPVYIERVTWELKDQVYNKYRGEWEFPVIGSMTQIPLKLGWAITIHKYQGLTIPNLYVDNSNIFAPGQFYVALSRATSLDGLRISNTVCNQHIFVDKKLKTYFNL